MIVDENNSPDPVLVGISMSKPSEGDGKFVVVENGQRVSDLHDTQDQALKEAEARKKLAETQGEQPSTVQVKQNLFG